MCIKFILKFFVQYWFCWNGNYGGKKDIALLWTPCLCMLIIFVDSSWCNVKNNLNLNIYVLINFYVRLIFNICQRNFYTSYLNYFWTSCVNVYYDIKVQNYLVKFNSYQCYICYSMIIFLILCFGGFELKFISESKH